MLVRDINVDRLKFDPKERRVVIAHDDPRYVYEIRNRVVTNNEWQIISFVRPNNMVLVPFDIDLHMHLLEPHQQAFVMDFV
jgi:hypothetical protein